MITGGSGVADGVTLAAPLSMGAVVSVWVGSGVAVSVGSGVSLGSGVGVWVGMTQVSVVWQREHCPEE